MLRVFMEKSEEILGVVPHAFEGWGKTDIKLFFTSKRIVVAKVLAGDYFIREEVVLSKAYTQKRSTETGKLTPEAILGSDKKNYFLPYSHALKFVLKKPSTLRDGKIRVTTATSEKKFGISKIGLLKVNKYDFSFLDKLQEILGDKMMIE